MQNFKDCFSPLTLTGPVQTVETGLQPVNISITNFNNKGPGPDRARQTGSPGYEIKSQTNTQTCHSDEGNILQRILILG